MTPEQKQVIDKCKRMLKVAFPDLTGHLEFHMVKNEDRVKAKVMYGDA